jgi:hypothetical protein
MNGHEPAIGTGCATKPFADDPAAKSRPHQSEKTTPTNPHPGSLAQAAGGAPGGTPGAPPGGVHRVFKVLL